MKILVTGAYGQLGRELKELADKYSEFEFVFTDIDTLDITDEDKVYTFFTEQKPDYVINCAAYTAVDKAEEDEESAEKINALAPKILGIYSRIIGAKFIHISTDYVFDGNKCTPYVESDAVSPQGVYGKTKLLGELNCLKENPHSVIIRTSWLYSSFGNNFVKTMLKLGSERDDLKVVFDQLGTPTYAADLARTILTVIKYLLAHPEDFYPGVYHYSNEGVASWFDFATAIFDIKNINCNVKPVLSAEFPTTAKRPQYSVLDKSKIRDGFGVEIPYWRESLKKCLTKIN